MCLPKCAASPQGKALFLLKRNLITEFRAKYFFPLFLHSFFSFFPIRIKRLKNDENEVVNNDVNNEPKNNDAEGTDSMTETESV